MRSISIVVVFFLIFSNINFIQGNQKQKKLQNTFYINNPDYKLSPFTGMTRKHWFDAALYLLKGAFSYVHNLDDPMKFPKLVGKSYPRNDNQIPIEKLEGLSRTLLLAVPLLKENPDLTINGIKVAKYYRHQILNLLNPENLSYIKNRDVNKGPSQILVEFGTLSISLFIIRDILWDPLTRDQKNALAGLMMSYGDGPTLSTNWRFFNIFILSFFKSQGYSINNRLLENHLNRILKHYKGEGWYNDNPAYDYYSMWAFQLYGILWTKYFGDEYYPEYVKQFKENFRELKESYPYMFAQDGKMIMWGRSISYRFAAVVPLSLMGLKIDPDINYGWMRRIASGTILQFLQNPDFLKDQVPTLGFYGEFDPAVQFYNCRGSVYWCGKGFLGLLLLEDNPFWTTKENQGAWDNEISNETVRNKFLKDSNILITNYSDIGASEIRSWCYVPVISNRRKHLGDENYNRLSYNSAFPWQADGKNGETAMNYVFKNRDNQWEPFRMYNFKRFEDGIYYRDAVLETNYKIKFQLADCPIKNGILRVDINRSEIPCELRLGHYALAKKDHAIKKEIKKMDGYRIWIINNEQYQLAMIPYQGWQDAEILNTRGFNPVNKISSIINVTDNYKPLNKGKLYITLMLWKKAHEKWSQDELQPIKKATKSDNGKQVTIEFKDNSKKIFNF